jgi:hypothetical protein
VEDLTSEPHETGFRGGVDAGQKSDFPTQGTRTRSPGKKLSRNSTLEFPAQDADYTFFFNDRN